MDIQQLGNKLTIEVEALPIVNYATQQNGIRLVRTLFIVNPTREAVTDLEIEICSTPSFTLPFSCHLDKISPNSRYEVKEANILLDGNYLIGITERLTGTLQIVLKKGNASVCTDQKEITVLAYDEWPGVSNCPELISSFVTPNNPSIVPISARAASLMEYWTHDPSLTGYQRNDSNHVLKMAAAVYSAIKEKNIVYSMPPASFEISGQRIRMVDDVLNTKFGTCLDLSVLYASCLESIGLNPIMVFFKGHACCGVWLTDNNMPECASDDVAVLTKRIADGLNEIALIECTCLVAGNNASFEDAKSVAEKKIFEEDSFEYVIDVHRCRIAGIKPIPSKSQIEKGVSIDRPDISVDSHAPTDLKEVSETTQTAITAATRKSNWEHKLLDLGLRNTLINLRFTRNLVPILCGDINELEDGLSTGREYSIHGRPEEWKLTEGTTVANHILDSNQKSVIVSEFKSGRLRSLYSESEIQGSLKDLFRNAKLSIEENGANTLYLALGMLRWYESASSTDKPRFAPIILLPVDLSRRGGGEGFSLRLRDDDPQINITILEKLKQDFNLVIEGLDPLPQDDNGIDTRKVFTTIRRSIMAQKGWDVIETACIGLFSFTQFVMWHDLHERSDDLEKNKIVKSLIEGRLMWDAEPMVPQNGVNEDEALLPIPTDASQLYAIKKAASGNSFVLQGPPGTGKSQAITAMIANALAMNKTVLFVAEKMAALEVVEKRLQKIGIGDFCLELHSNKAKKKSVLDQLKKTLERAKISPSEYADKADKIAELRYQLDCYANELHKERSCKLSLYELINQYEENITAPDIANLDETLFTDFEKMSVEDLINQAERLSAAGKYIGSPKNHPLSMVGCTEYHQSIRSDLTTCADAYISSLKTLQEIAGRVGSKLNLKCESFEELEKIYALTNIIELWKGIPRKWALQEEFPFYIEQIERLAKSQLELAERKDRWEKTWKQESETLPAELLLNEYRSANSSWLVSKLLGINTLKKKITPFMHVKPTTDDLELELVVLDSYQKARKNADELLNLHAGKLDYEYQGDKTDWHRILSLTDLAKSKEEALRNTIGSDGVRIVLFSVPDLFDISDEYKAAWSKMQEAKAPLYDLLIIKEGVSTTNWLNDEVHGIAEILKHKDELKEFIAWNDISQECRAMGMSSLVDAYTNGIGSDLVVSAFKKCLFRQLIEKTIDTSKTLSTFSGVQFNERILQFKKMDDTLTKLTQKEIYYRLSSNLPNITKEAAQSSELGILQRAIRSGGRGQSIRKLIEQIPTMLPRLCPCMLMSPISAAQYLDPHREPFDIVIFDEASQISTAKAVGVLARGKDAVIVGDPKQMPPTSFFATNTVDEENFANEDLESILEDCLAINMPQTSLLWHYRSRHESLISFSNSEFYNNELYTFPSVNDRDAKVTFVKVDGIFERGKSRQNKKEAEAVLEEIIRRAHDDQVKDQSVGVVTFNIVQQNLIDDMLSEAAASDPVLFSWAYESEEPIFIKNLENVQGDERDVILFSIGYGPDTNGKISMNFGPLNRDGGWRRLNVAVTRAREEMKVFSSLEPDDINLSRTGAEGVKALKEFLQYAKDHMVTESADTICDVPETKGIIESICEALKAKGYKTDVLVGHSEYRIDIGIVDRNNPEKYILGILLDGKNYKDAKTTRDREIAQINVLNELGWNIHRIWSVDWWDNKNKELSKIFDEIDRLESTANASTEKSNVECNDLVEPIIDEELEETIVVEQKNLVPPVYSARINNYLPLSPEEFNDSSNRNILRHCANALINTEAPISHEFLLKRMVHNAGLSRTGSRMRASIEFSISLLNPFTTTSGGIFYWNSKEDSENYHQIRSNGTGDSNRTIEDISYHEIENAIISVIAEQGAMETEDLLRQTAKVFGFLRVADNISRRLNEALEFASKEGFLILKNNRFGLSEKGETKASLILEWIKNNGILQTSAEVSQPAENKPKRVIQTISWDEYEDHDDWSDSTKLSRFSRVEPLCDSETLSNYLYTFEDEKNALKLVEKAIARGMRFSLEDAIEVVSNAGGDLSTFISALNFDSAKIDDFFEFMDCIDETYYPAVIESAAKEGLKIDVNWFIENECYFNEDIQELFIKTLLVFNSIRADVLFNSIGDIFDGKGAELILSKAIDMGLQPKWEAARDIIDSLNPITKGKWSVSI